MTSPWLTRKQAGQYLAWSVSTVDRRLVPMQPRPAAGKMRFTTIRTDGERRAVRILAEDVYRLLPLPTNTSAGLLATAAGADTTERPRINFNLQNS